MSDRIDAARVTNSLLASKSSSRGLLSGVHSMKKEEPPEVTALTADVVPPASEHPVGHSEEYQRLGYLRPRDTFYFVKVVPYAGVDLRTEYRIVPAPRGFIRFTDDYQSVYEVPLDYAVGVQVKLTIEEGRDHSYPFYPGDKVKSMDTGAMGEVLRAKAMGYEVRFEGYEESTWVPSGTIRLIDKDLTTRNYLRQADGQFIVSYADVYEVRDRAVDAIEFLKNSNRPAYNRLSKLICAEGVSDFPWVDRAVLDYCVQHDPRVWTREKVELIFSEPVPDK